MKLIKIIAIYIILIVTVSLGQEKKIAQTGMQFTSVTSDARIAALGGATISTNIGNAAFQSNPACATYLKDDLQVSLSNNKWIADINYYEGILSVKPFGGDYGTFGIIIQSVDYGEIHGTRVANNEQGYIETGNISPNAFSIGFGYAKKISDKFSVGGNIKYNRQNLGESQYQFSEEEIGTKEYNLSTISIDFGTLYHTGIKSLSFGMVVKNFSPEIKYVEETFQLPLSFSIGISLDLIDLIPEYREYHKLKASFATTHYKSHDEQVSFGLEYIFNDIISLRLGYLYGNDEDDISYGIGFNKYNFAFDYSYTPFGVFNNVQRLTARFSF